METKSTHAPWLLEHEGFLRRLASDLVGDAHSAEDLLQRTYLYALESPPNLKCTPRSWFRKVMRHLAIDHALSEQRRRDREARVAREDLQPVRPPGCEQREVKHRLAGAIDELPEPYRTAIVLRYEEELGPRDIAARANVSVETIKTRLKRGRGLLRDKLDREYHGDTRLWALPLLAFVSGGRRRGPSMAPQTKRAIGVAAACLGGLALLALVDGAPAAARSTEVPRLEREVAALVPAIERGDEPVAPVARFATHAVEPAAETATAARAFDIQCRVVDERGRAVAGIPVVFEPEEGSEAPPRRAVSDANGVARVERIEGWGQLTTDADDWITFLAAYVHGYAPLDPAVIQVGPRLPVRGQVVDRDGRPLDGVEVQLSRSLRHSLPSLADNLYSFEGCQVRGLSDVAGHFDFAAPMLESALLRFSRRGYEEKSVPMWKARGVALRVVMAPASADKVRKVGDWIGGVVRDVLGHPVAGATVSSGAAMDVTDDEGTFAVRVDALARVNHALRLRDPLGGVQLVAAKEGHSPALVRVVDGDDAPDVELVLGPALRALTGRVVDPGGRALEGIRVWAADLTCMTASGVRGLAVECVSAGKDELDISLDRTSWLAAEVTDAEGRFALPHLLDRPYVLRALDPESGARVQAGPFARGESGAMPGAEGAILTLDPEAVWMHVRGRVATPDGRGAPRAIVWLLSEDQELMRGDGTIGIRRSVLAKASTASDGSFSVGPVPHEGAQLVVTGDEVFTTAFRAAGETPLGDRDEPELDDVRLEVPLRVLATLRLADPREAIGVRAYLTSDGDQDRQRACPLTVTRAKPHTPYLFLTDDIALFERGETTVWLPDAPTVLDLYDGDTLVRRVELPALGSGPHHVTL